MPRFDTDSNLVQHKAGHFGFSAAKIEDLGATEYTLVTICADRSGSTDGFQKDMENVVKEVVRSCQHSPRADNLMIRFVTFDSSHKEEHGFKLLTNCNLDDYNDTLLPGGCTALCDAVVDAVEAEANYGKQLQDQDFAVNGIVFVITDGAENASKTGPNQVREALSQVVKKESMESFISILIAVNPGDYSAVLTAFNKDCGFTQYVELKDASKKTLAKLAQFVSQSISSQSSALGTGNASQPVNPSVVF